MKALEHNGTETAFDPIQRYDRLTEENLTSRKVCHAPGNSGLMFYIDFENRLFVCNTLNLKAPLSTLEQLKKAESRDFGLGMALSH